MIRVEGTLHDGQTSRAHAAALVFYADGSLRLEREGRDQPLDFAALRVPDRLANTPRRIELPEGATFETVDNDGVDEALRLHGASRSTGWLHRMEQRTLWVALATVVVVFALGIFAVRGIPALARSAAFALPSETTTLISQGTLELLDESFEPSELPEARRASLRAAFDAITAEEPGEYAFELAFRRGEIFGANAFALPGGTVILTDELVELAEDDRELIGVLAHEVGHVVHRHGLRQAIQNSMVAVAIVLVVGDLSAASGFVAGLPAALAEARFSREFEIEADDHARAYLEFHGMDPAHLARILQRMEDEQGDDGVSMGFLASHPATEERIERLTEAP